MDNFYESETKLLFHELTLTSSLLRREDFFDRFVKIVEAALLISDKVRFRVACGKVFDSFYSSVGLGP